LNFKTFWGQFDIFQ